MVKKILRILFIVITSLLILAVIFIGTIDKTPIREKSIYEAMMKTIDTMSITSKIPQHPLKCGWSKVNLMPEFKTPMAGYAPKNPYEEVHDSLFVRTTILSNGNATIAIMSFDLLITPPLLAERLGKNIKNNFPQVDFIYFSASHTHNGIGGWDNSFGGQLITGDFDKNILDHIYRSSVRSISLAIDNMKFADIDYIEAEAGKYVRNRLDNTSATDGKIRGIKLNLQEGEKILIFAFSAHATNIPRKSKMISNDYPGELIKDLEEEYDFAQFLAGAVGSHSLDNIPGHGLEKTDSAGVILSKIVLDHIKSPVQDSITIAYQSITVMLDEPQMRLSDNLRVRNWAFKAIFNPLEAEIRILKLGNILMLGMPCDFSGEILIDDHLYDFAQQRGLQLIVTSFNGDYIGYITEDSHYNNSKKAEVMTMNWVGPYHGAYFSDIVKKLIQKVDK